MKYLQSVILIFSATVILFGFYQLNHENDIFAQKEPNCCNNLMCNFYQGTPALCTETATALLFSDLCSFDYLMTCKDCVEKSEQGLVCKNPLSSCEDQFGDCYGWCLLPSGKWGWNLAQK